MAKSILPYIASSKLLIDSGYLDKIVVNHILGEDTPSYKPSVCASSTEVVVTNSLDNLDTVGEALFYYEIFGPIVAQDYGYDWMFSTQRFIRQLADADNNPNIIAHFVHICSGGGEAWLLDKAAEAMRNCKKPIYVFFEMYCCSAGYYLAVNGSVIKAYTQNDIVGSIGTMVNAWDVTGYWESLHMKHIEEYATKSDLKNKKSRDLFAGKPEQYIKEELDPLQMQFETEVRNARSVLGKLPEDSPVFRGETFSATQAILLGLIDGIIDFEDAIIEAYALGITNKNNNNLLKNL